MSKPKYVLGIESTCDETAASILGAEGEVLSEVISSQVDLHNIYGGVVPEIASRRHMEVILPVIQEALKGAQISLKEIELVAVANGPGLVGPLYVGIQTAKAIAFGLNIPIIGVNHVEAHLFASYMSLEKPISFPALGVVVSGGHTVIVLIKEMGTYSLLGQTIDDACGEAFDKVAKILALPYPGGPEIERLAKEGDPEKFLFKPGRSKENPLHFSFSGLKTAVLYGFQRADKSDPHLKANIAASFQRAALLDIVNKAKLASLQTGCKDLLLGGGVTNSQELRRLFKEKAKELHCHFPSKTLSLDNGTMIAGLGAYLYQRRGGSDLFSLEAKTRIPFTKS